MEGSTAVQNTIPAILEAIGGVTDFLIGKMADMVEFNFINSTKMLKSYHKKKAEQIAANEVKIDN